MSAAVKTLSIVLTNAALIGAAVFVHLYCFPKLYQPESSYIKLVAGLIFVEYLLTFIGLLPWLILIKRTSEQSQQKREERLNEWGKWTIITFGIHSTITNIMYTIINRFWNPWNHLAIPVYFLSASAFSATIPVLKILSNDKTRQEQLSSPDSPRPQNAISRLPALHSAPQCETTEEIYLSPRSLHLHSDDSSRPPPYNHCVRIEEDDPPSYNDL